MKRALFIVVAVAVAGALVWTFLANRMEAAQEAQRERPVNAPNRVSVVSGSTVITLDQASQRASGIATTEVVATDYRQEIRAYGAVLDLGRLVELFNSYAVARAEVQIARARLAASRTAFERAQTLYKEEQNVSLARLQEAEAAFRSDEASMNANQSRANTLAAAARQEWGAVLAKALIEGGSLIMRLIDRQDVLLQVTLPPDVALAQPPSTAQVGTGRQARAQVRLLSAAPRTDPKIQGRSFFYLAPADSGLLPGMSVIAYLAKRNIAAGAVIPSEAIVWWQDRAWIYRRTALDSFTRTPIATDQPVAGGYAVRDIPGGSEVVTRGAQLLLSEEFRAHIRVEE